MFEYTPRSDSLILGVVLVCQDTIKNSMVGCNCALYGCPTSRTREFAI